MGGSACTHRPRTTSAPRSRGTGATARAVETFTAAPGSYPVVDPVAHAASFVLAPEKTVASVLERFDATRSTYLAVLRAIDPDAPTLAPAPWTGVPDERRTRWRLHLVHQLEELARHAGHADILREQVDGVSVPALVAGVDGA